MEEVWIGEVAINRSKRCTLTDLVYKPSNVSIPSLSKSLASIELVELFAAAAKFLASLQVSIRSAFRSMKISY